MSFSYSMIPLVDVVSEEEGSPRIDKLPLDIPPSWRDSKPVTPSGFHAVLKDWNACLYHEWFNGKDLTIGLAKEPEPTRASTMATIDDYHSEESMAHWLRLAYGEPEWLVTVAERIAQAFGPVLLICDVGIAIIVSAGTPADAEWTDCF